MSPRPRALPNRLDEPSSEGALGLNLEPMAHESSLSAAPEVNAGPLLRFACGSGSGALERLERHWSAPSDTLGGGASLSRPPGGPSKRRLDESRSGASGSGPSRLHGLSNLPSSSLPKPPACSLAKEQCQRRTYKEGKVWTYVARQR